MCIYASRRTSVAIGGRSEARDKSLGLADHAEHAEDD